MSRENEKTGRNRIIYQEKKNGTPVVDLAVKYGVSLPRIHRICLREENKELKVINEQLRERIKELEDRDIPKAVKKDL